MSDAPSSGEKTESSSSSNMMKQSQQKEGGEAYDRWYAHTLHSLVTESTQTSPHVMAWTSDGKAFSVSPDHPQMKDLLKRYFENGRYNSFRRKIIQYGFKKLPSGVNAGCYALDGFTRDSVGSIQWRPYRLGPPPSNTTASSSNGPIMSQKERDEGFAHTLHSLVTDSTKTSPNLVAWTSDGKALFVGPDSPQLTELLKRYFENGKREAFRRKINQYGFKQLRSGVNAGCYALEGFTRDSVGTIQWRSHRFGPPPSDTTSSSDGPVMSQKERDEAFAHTLHSLVTDSTKTSPNLVAWTSDGKALFVGPDSPQLTELLKRYFENGKREAFRRKINQYGFKQLRSGVNAGCYALEGFTRDSVGTIQWRSHRFGPPPSDTISSSDGPVMSQKERDEAFAHTLHSLVTDSTKTSPNLVAWTSDGKALFVGPDSPQLTELLKRYFENGKREAFRRKINQYGFKQLRSGVNAGCYALEGFTRDSVGTIQWRSYRLETAALATVSKPSVSARGRITRAPKKFEPTEQPQSSRGRRSTKYKQTNSLSINPRHDDACNKAKAEHRGRRLAKPKLDVIDGRGCVFWNSKERPPHGTDSYGMFVYKLVSEITETDPEVLSWTRDGSAIYVDEKHPQLQKVMSRYFDHQNFESFRKRLNRVGFIKHLHGPNQGCFQHADFHRDHVERVDNISLDGCKRHASTETPALAADDKPSVSARGRSTNAPKKFEATEQPRSFRDRPGTSRKKSCSGASSTGSEKSNKNRTDSSTEESEKLGSAASGNSKRLDDYDQSSSEGSVGSGAEDSRDFDDGSSKADESEIEGPTTESKYQVFQRVFARDQDGVMYEAVIRRKMFGPHHHKQVQVGLAKSFQEVQELVNQEPEPCWHYFVHYGKWNVNWDRWVSEHDIYEYTDEIKAYASRLLAEHRALQKDLTKKRKGKKGWQTIDGREFLREWRKRMDSVDEEMRIKQIAGESSTGTADVQMESTEADGVLEKTDTSGETTMSTSPSETATDKPIKPTAWTKAALAMEGKLRQKSLTSKRKQSHANKIVIPFALKKVLVENWEVISQCHMMPCLPASVTVRQALDQYLESKGVVVTGQKEDDASDKKDGAENEMNKSAEPSSIPPRLANEQAQEAKNVQPESSEPAAQLGGNVEKLSSDDSDSDKRTQEWIEMADGIAMFFDEALPKHLLYREELPQLRVLDSFPDLATKRYSEIYGCEHLLRLMVRLPEMLADELTEAEARPILAKVNDFVRFLNKNETTLFVQSHRKLNDAELKEQQKMLKSQERKRKSSDPAASGEVAVAKKPRLVGASPSGQNDTDQVASSS